MKKIITRLLVLIISIFLVGCLAEEKEEKELKLTFKLNGVEKKYECLEENGFSSSFTYGEYYTNSWFNDDGDAVNISLPLGVISGATYTVGEEHVNFSIDPEDGYFNYADDGFIITITEWSNVDGGIIKGTFSGTVDVDGEAQTVTEGKFESRYTPDAYN